MRKRTFLISNAVVFGTVALGFSSREEFPADAGSLEGLSLEGPPSRPDHAYHAAAEVATTECAFSIFARREIARLFRSSVHVHPPMNHPTDS